MTDEYSSVLSEQISFINGDRGKNYPKQDDYINGTVPFISAADLSSNALSADASYQKKITPEAYEKLRSGKVKKDDILLCLRGSLGKLGIVKEEMTAAIASSLVIIRPNKFSNVEFLYQWLKSSVFQETLASFDNGSVQGNLSVKSISAIPVPRFDCNDQKAIAHILGTLDDKIELNQKMNETLEGIAKAIFKSWFVDFDPVRAKMEGRPTGLPDDISDLFPDELVESEVGEIPKGWERLKFGDVAKVTSGKRPPEKESSKSDLHPYTVYGGAGPMAFCSEPLDFSLPSIITGRVGTLGKVFYINHKCWVSDNSILISDAGDYAPLIFYTLKSLDLTVLNVGSTQPLVTGKDIKNLSVMGPPDRLLVQFVSMFDLLKQRQSTTVSENQTLSELRDILLPKLISGELKIPDAEKFLEEAGI